MSKAKEPKNLAAPPVEPITPVIPPVVPVIAPPVELIAPDETVEIERVAPESLEDDSADARNADQNEQGEAGEPFVKSGFAKVQLKNFRGGYLNSHFNDDGLCERVSHETLEELFKQFPGIEVEFAEEVD